MKFEKSPPELIAKFDSIVPGPPVERKLMFGYAVQLPENQREELIKKSGAKIFEPMPGRRMREYIVVPKAILSATKKSSPRW